MTKLPLGISSCLLGNPVRYDGNHKHDRYITDTLGQFFEFIAVCPEVECGLPVPREAMRLVDRGAEPRLLTIKTGLDHTDRMNTWSLKKLDALAGLKLSGFIFKAKSPSSGMADVKIYSPQGAVAKKGAGLFAKAFMERFPLIPVIDEGRLHDPLLRENFIERVFVYRRWMDLAATKPKVADLMKFHASHKYLIMSYRPAAVAKLGALVAACPRTPQPEHLSKYGSLLMETLSSPATVKNQTNTLQHIAGYFKELLSPDQKQELQAVIDSYHQQLVPLIVPITLLKHFTRLFKQEYLATQVYLNPHPLELMLRNHV